MEDLAVMAESEAVVDLEVVAVPVRVCLRFHFL